MVIKELREEIKICMESMRTTSNMLSELSCPFNKVSRSSKAFSFYEREITKINDGPEQLLGKTTICLRNSFTIQILKADPEMYMGFGVIDEKL